MMEHLERKIREKLQQDRIEVNTDDLWNEVYPHIKPEKNHRVAFYMLFGMFWLVSVVGVGWYFYDDGEHALTTNELVEANTQSDRAKVEAVDTTGKIESQLDVTSISESEESVELENEVGRNSASHLIRPIQFERPASFDEISTANTSTTVANPGSNSNLKLSTPQVKFEGLGVQQINNANTITAEEQLEKETIKPVYEATGIDNDNSDSSNEYTSIKPLKKNINPIEYFYPQPILPNELGAYNQRSNYSRFSVYALGGFYATNRTLTADGVEPPPNLVSRNLSETPLESLSGELGASYRFTDNLMLSAGINYIRINEKIEDTYAVTDTVLLENVIIEYIISSRGSEPVYGNIQAERTVNTSLKAFNKYTDISLSLDLTYFLEKRKFTPYFSLGIQQSIQSTQSGFWLLDGSLYDLTNDDNGYLSTNYGLGFRAGVGGHLKLSERTNLVLGARYNQYLSPITNQNYELKQRYNLLGLHAGFMVKI